MIAAAGIDLGGTKIEAQVFDDGWRLAARRRWTTPKDYDALIEAMARAVGWCAAHGTPGMPIGVAAAGLIQADTGRALTANLPASGRTLPAEIAQAAGHHIAWVNDCRALALSEAVLGAARGATTAVGLVLGTGVAGGVIISGTLAAGHAGVGGEFGHFALPARPIVDHGLPILQCGCGRTGCAESYLAAPGLQRIAAHVTGRTPTPQEIIAGKTIEPGLARTWAIWLDIAAEFLMTICLTVDPDVIVLGGGLSRAPGICDELKGALEAVMFSGFAVPSIRLAEGGDASGARGAALAAWQEPRG